MLDDAFAEIKTVEKNGWWSIRTKIRLSAKQGANTLILYYPNKDLFELNSVQEGWQLLDSDPYSVALRDCITRIMVVLEDRIVEIAKPPG